MWPSRRQGPVDRWFRHGVQSAPSEERLYAAVSGMTRRFDLLPESPPLPVQTMSRCPYQSRLSFQRMKVGRFPLLSSRTATERSIMSLQQCSSELDCERPV